MRKLSLSVVMLGAAVVCTVSCHQDGGRELQHLSGLATFGHEVRSFRPCGSEEDLWAIDSSGALWDLHREFAPGLEPYEGVFAVVTGTVGPPPEEGFGADYGESLVVEEVLYAAGEGFGCDSDWSRFSYRAQGNEPFWTLDLSPLSMELHLLGEGTRAWTPTQEDNADEVVRITGQALDGRSIEVTLLREPCRDSMAGAYFGFSAIVRIEGEELTGCGLKGSYPEYGSYFPRVP